jgi:alpha-L-fucosidase
MKLFAAVAGMMVVCGCRAAAGQLPSANQLALLSRPTGLSQFMHFSVNQFDLVNHTQHNCVGYGPCLPASLFSPTNLSTDQWVETAAAFGAEEICLTAHHEGGFSLWDTNTAITP